MGGFQVIFISFFYILLKVEILQNTDTYKKIKDNSYPQYPETWDPL